MTQRIMTFNIGSSSVKFAVYSADSNGDPKRHLSGQASALDGNPKLEATDEHGRELVRTVLELEPDQQSHVTALQQVIAWIEEHFIELKEIAVVAHRVVHDGGQFDGPVRVDEEVLAKLERLIPFVPEHQPHNLKGIRIIAEQHPEVTQVASFDTTFHRNMPWVEQTFALPKDFFDRGLRRFGFHGLSYDYITHELPHHLDRAHQAKIVIAHLGHGASLCAVDAGRSIATTMGLTALDGMPMAQRCGRIDPGLVPYLVAEEGRDIEEVLDLLYKSSGLLGVSGISGDMRHLLESREPLAAQAIDLFVHAARKEICALAGCLEGLDALVFTGGVGENSGEVRDRICQGLSWLGVSIDPTANRAGQTDISAATSQTRVFALPTNEEFILARDALHALDQRQS